MACKNDECACADKKTKATVQSGIPVLEIIPMEHMFKLPEYAHPGDSGMDIFAANDEMIWTNRVTKVQTGVSFNIPEGYEIQVRSRSGLASKGIVVANSPGTVDSCYTGEVCVLLTNLNESIIDGMMQGYEIKKGDRIAQLVFSKVPEVKLVVGKELKTTVRGADGFGSSGV